MPSNVSEMRLPSKPRRRRLPPDEPYGSEFTKFRPGTRFSDWMIVWPGVWVEMYSWVIDERVLATVSATIVPSVVGRPRRPVTTTSSTVVSVTSVPVDWAAAAPAAMRPVKRAVVAQNARLRFIIVINPR